MTSFLVSSFSKIVEVSLWLLFFTAAVLGYMGGEASGVGIVGVLIGLTCAFLFSVFFVAPFLMIGDIRERVRAIEKVMVAGGDNAFSSGEKDSRSPIAAPQIRNTPPESAFVNGESRIDDEDGARDDLGFDNSGRRIYQGQEIHRREGKFFVGDIAFSTLGKAKRHIQA